MVGWFDYRPWAVELWKSFDGRLWLCGPVTVESANAFGTEALARAHLARGQDEALAHYAAGMAASQHGEGIGS